MPEASSELKAGARAAAHEAPGAPFTRRAWHRTVMIHTIRLVVVGGFFLLWEIASGRWIEPFLISSPSKIWVSFVNALESGDLVTHTWVTFQEIGIGFPIGAISGIWVGYLFGRSRALAEVFEPIIIALYGVPRTALAPLFIVWLGIGIWSKVGVVFILVFFLNFFNTYSGMKQLDQEFVDLARLMGAGRWRLSFRVILPAVSPYILTGFKTSIPFSVIGAITGEFIAATEGLGFFIRQAAGVFRTADVFVGIAVLMLLVIVMNKVADLIERRVLRWQTQTESVRVQG
jgi:NitT/TauT family transport system permease protein